MNSHTPAVTQRQLNAMAILGLIGAMLGRAVGIAALGGAIAGTLPLAVIGLILGYALF